MFRPLGHIQGHNLIQRDILKAITYPVNIKRNKEMSVKYEMFQCD